MLKMVSSGVGTEEEMPAKRPGLFIVNIQEVFLSRVI